MKRSRGRDFGVALGALRRGERVRRAGWRPGRWIAVRLASDNPYVFAGDESLGGRRCALDSDDLLATDWLIFAEDGA